MYDPLTCNCTIDVIAEQMQAFQSRWAAKVSSTGARVLSDAALKEIKNLQEHIKKGCLSGAYVTW